MSTGFEKIGAFYKQFLTTAPEKVQMRRKLMNIVNEEFDTLPPHLKSRFLLIESIVHTHTLMTTTPRKQLVADAKTPGTLVHMVLNEFKRRYVAYVRSVPPSSSPLKSPPPTMDSMNFKNFDWSLMGSTPLPHLDLNSLDFKTFERPVIPKNNKINKSLRRPISSSSFTGPGKRVKSATPSKSSSLDLSRILDDLIENQEVISKRRRLS